MNKLLGTNKNNDPFPRDEDILSKKDRRQKVTKQRLVTFPYNNIGWIQSRLKQSNDNQNYQQAKGTGFLISQYLVLTSSHNFTIRKEEEGEVVQFQPIFFSTMQPENGVIVQKNHKVKAVKTNFRFISLLTKIVLLKNSYYNQQDDVKKQKYFKQILALQEESVQHDFALLKLQKPIKRSRYFSLYPMLSQICQLSVTGYVHIYGRQFYLFTHSNPFDSIIKGSINYDIDTKEGQSGSPVYLTDDYRVVGIHKAYNPQKKRNFATMITQPLIKSLQSWAQQLDASFQAPSNNLILLKPKAPSIPKQPKLLPAFAYLNKKQSSNKKTQADELMEKADQLRDLQQMNDALEFYQKSKSAYQSSKGSNSVQFAKALSGIGYVLLYQKRYQQSLQCYITQLSVYQKISKEDIIQKANVLGNISIVLFRQNKTEESLENYQKAVKIYSKMGIQSITSPFTIRCIGLMHYLQYKLNQALQCYCKALYLYKKLGKRSIGWANTLYDIGIVYKSQGKQQQALRYYNEALHFYNKLNIQSICQANTLSRIASVHEQQDKQKQALQIYNKALRVYEKLGKNTIEWADTLDTTANLYRKVGKLQQALQHYKKALSIQQTLGDLSKGQADTLMNIAQVYQQMDQVKKAEQFLARSKEIKDILL